MRYDLTYNNTVAPKTVLADQVHTDTLTGYKYYLKWTLDANPPELWTVYSVDSKDICTERVSMEAYTND